MIAPGGNVGPWAWDLVPSGSALLRLRREMRFRTSLLMLWAMPGYWGKGKWRQTQQPWGLPMAQMS